MPDSPTNGENILNRSFNTRQERIMKDTGSHASYSPKSPLRRTADKNALTCGLCSATFTHSSTLKAHVHAHTGEKPHKCRHCEASFTWPSALRRHVRTHTGEKPYECTTCKAVFSNLCNLKSHIRTHTGEKPFKCTACKAVFSESINLKVHMRIHTGEKPYKCSNCTASFSQSQSLKSHMRTHTDEKPFQCTVCQASFLWSGNLKRHMMTHASKKPRMRTNADEMPYVTTVCQPSFCKQGSSEYCTRACPSEPYKCDHCTSSFFQSPELKSHVKTHAVLTSFHAADNFDSHENKCIGASDMSSHHIGYVSHTCTINCSQEEVKKETDMTESSYGLSVSQENMEIKTEDHDLNLEMTAIVDQDLFDG